MDGFLWICVIIVVACIVIWPLCWIALRKLEGKVGDMRATALAAIPDFTPAVTYWNVVAGYGLALDPERERFAITKIDEPARVFGFDQLVAVEVQRDGHSITRTDRGGQALGAAAGAVLLGPVGLLLGGLSGGSTTQSKVTSLSLKIYTTDLICPVYEVIFYAPISGTATSNLQAAAQELDAWYGRFRTIMHMRSHEGPVARDHHRSAQRDLSERNGSAADLT